MLHKQVSRLIKENLQAFVAFSAKCSHFILLYFQMNFPCIKKSKQVREKQGLKYYFKLVSVIRSEQSKSSVT